MIYFVLSTKTIDINIMTTAQKQLHNNINLKASWFKISPSLMADAIKFNAMVLRSKIGK